MESTRNYLISKAFEMDAFLRWAESAQAVEITHAHVGWLSNSGFCSDQEPHRLSRDLWGYLNLSLTGKTKITFNNVPKGEWIRGVAPHHRSNRSQERVAPPPHAWRCPSPPALEEAVRGHGGHRQVGKHLG